MNKKIYILVLSIFAILSCKEEKSSVKEENKNTTEQAKQDIELQKKYKDKIIIDMNLVFPVSDMIEVYYTTTMDKGFSPAKKIERWVNGSEESQHIEMTLPEGVYPTGLRLDWGRNPEKRQIVLNNLSFNYQMEKKVYIANKEVQNYFQPNEYIKYSADDNGVFMDLFPVGDKFDPYLKGTQVNALVRELVMKPQEDSVSMAK